MKIAIIGYGKMGKTIERLALNNNDEVVLKIDDTNLDQFTEENLKKADVAIEFSTPSVAFDSISRCIKAGVPTVSGTTGWLDKFSIIEDMCKDGKGAFFYASNFSVGVNIFFKLNEYLAKIMNNFSQFAIDVDETHHVHKLDAPSGTAITIAEGIIENVERKASWVKENAENDAQIAIKSHRIGEHPGEHVVKYDSPIESIEILHSSKTREGLAMGALMAAKFLIGKKGIYGMDDLLKLA
jgi:4-hydroxy-tetrahydrodipicolinate reductase